ncbi:MAG: ABC transporter permease [Ignavibacteriota bacterium]
MLPIVRGLRVDFQFPGPQRRQRIDGGDVRHPGLLRVMGLKPLLGRTFSDAETTFPTAPVVILGYDLWQRKFGGDPHIVGQTIRISRRDIRLP